MKILIDGDVVAYRVAYSSKLIYDETTQTEVKTPLTPIEAIEKLQVVMNDTKFLIDPYADYTVYLTGKGNFRYDVAKTAVYKGNRKDTPKPPNLPYLRQYMMDTYNCVVSENEEADDLIAIAAAKRDYKDTVIVSIDKDFMQLPVKIYNPMKDEWFHPTVWEATKFFYTQILTGDAVDNIKGVGGIGPKKAEKALEGCDSEKALYNACVEAFTNTTPADRFGMRSTKFGEDRVLENGRLLWLRRSVGQIWDIPK